MNECCLFAALVLAVGALVCTVLRECCRGAALMEKKDWLE